MKTAPATTGHDPVSVTHRPAVPGSGEPSQLKRRLGGFDATMLIVGDIVGIGIFTTTGFVADAFPHPAWILAVWILGGLLTLCGALTMAELGGALPRSGGEYVFLKDAYGRMAGFLNGWTYLAITNSGSIAALALALATYLRAWSPALADPAPLAQWATPFGAIAISPLQLAAVALVAVFSAANLAGVRIGGLIQDFLTVGKIGALLVIVVAGIALGRGHWGNFADLGPTLPPGGGAGAACGAAIAGILFSYSGWFVCTYVAGEIRQPESNIPRSLIAGTLVVTFLYAAVNVVYIYALPLARMRGVVNVGEVAVFQLFGGRVGAALAAVMVVTIMSAMNSVILTSPRIYYAMARDGLFFRSAGEVHPRFRTPANAILVQAVWASVLVLSGTFDRLLAYVGVAMVVFSIMTAAAVFVLRRRRPELPRPFRTPGYPWLPGIFLVAYLGLLAGLIVSRPRDSLCGLAALAAGMPVYWLWERWQRRTGADLRAAGTAAPESASGYEAGCVFSRCSDDNIQ